jgi:aryl-alcohol dehydrogenase-like predicted oxidoreductase
MKYRTLGNTDLNVSLLGLGTMTWGHQNSEQDAHRQLDLALAHGVNLLDTAEMYPTPTHGCNATGVVPTSCWPARSSAHRASRAPVPTSATA